MEVSGQLHAAALNPGKDSDSNRTERCVGLRAGLDAIRGEDKTFLPWFCRESNLGHPISCTIQPLLTAGII
jgi:hypothetical protein